MTGALRRFPAILVGAAALCGQTGQPPAEQRFALVMQDLSRAEFVKGGVLRVPTGKVKQLEFRIGPPASKRIAPGGVSVEINGSPMDSVVQSGEQMVVKVMATVDEPDLFQTGKPNNVTIRVRNSREHEYRNSWIVERTERLFITETAGDDEGVPVELKLVEPPLPILAPGSKPLTLAVKGTVNRRAVTVTVNGTETAATPRPDGLSSEFSTRLTLEPSTPEIWIEATGAKQDFGRLVVPVRRAGR